MIGDREYRPEDDDLGPAEDLGPLDAMVRLHATWPGNDLFWVERYGLTVVTRQTSAFDPVADPGGVTIETMYPTEAAAVREFACRVAGLIRRGCALAVD